MTLLHECLDLEYRAHDIFYEKSQSKEFYRSVLRRNKPLALAGMYLANARLSEDIKRDLGHDYESKLKEARTTVEKLEAEYKEFSAVYRD